MTFRFYLCLFLVLISCSVSAKVTVKQAELIQDRIANLYKSHPINLKHKIIFLNHWHSDYSNASSRWAPEIKTRFIEVHRGVLESSISEAGFAFLICHELGHQFGGKPYIHANFELSVEGQSDYFASLDCAKRYF